MDNNEDNDDERAQRNRIEEQTEGMEARERFTRKNAAAFRDVGGMTPDVVYLIPTVKRGRRRLPITAVLEVSDEFIADVRVVRGRPTVLLDLEVGLLLTLQPEAGWGRVPCTIESIRARERGGRCALVRLRMAARV